MEKRHIEAPNFAASLLLFGQTDLCAVLLSGSVDTSVVERLREGVGSIASGRKLDYLVDLDEVTYISSTGLGFLMHLLDRKKEFVFLSNPRPVVLKPINLFDIKHLFRYYRDLEDLGKSTGLPEDVISAVRLEKGALRAAGPHKRGLETLADYLDNEDELHQIQRMTPYIHVARHHDAVAMPAEDKFAGVLYLFLERAFRRFAEHGGERFDEPTIELVSKELMTNSVKHGYQGREGGMVEVSYDLGPERLEIRFSDRGLGYRPGDRAAGDLPPAGLAMLGRLFDQLAVEEGPGGSAQGLALGPGTTVRLVKRLPQKPIQRS